MGIKFENRMMEVVMIPPGFEHSFVSRNLINMTPGNRLLKNEESQKLPNGKEQSKKLLKSKKKKKKKKNAILVIAKPLNEFEPELEYVEEISNVADPELMYRQFAKVFEAFKLVEPEKDSNIGSEAFPQYFSVNAAALAIANKLGSLIDDYDDDILTQQQQQTMDENGAPLFKRKLKNKLD